MKTEKNDRFAGMSDEEIVRIAQSEKDGQATDYIVHKYRNFVKSRLAPTFSSVPTGMTSSRKA